MKAYTIGPGIRDEWHWIQPYLDKVFDTHPDGYTSGMALEDVVAGRSMILVIEAEDAGVECVALLSQRPNALHVTSAAGTGLERWGHIAEVLLNDIARKMGVEHITSQARKGWAKLQTGQNGWREHGVYISKAVS
jgi:hypothetical protein